MSNSFNRRFELAVWYFDIFCYNVKTKCHTWDLLGYTFFWKKNFGIVLTRYDSLWYLNPCTSSPFHFLSDYTYLWRLDFLEHFVSDFRYLKKPLLFAISSQSSIIIFCLILWALFMLHRKNVAHYFALRHGVTLGMIWGWDFFPWVNMIFSVALNFQSDCHQQVSVCVIAGFSLLVPDRI